MTLEELIYKGTNTSGISNVSTRGQPTTSIFCKKYIKGSIKSAISENPSFKQFLEENNAYGRIESLIVIIVIERLLTALLAGVVRQKVAIIGLNYMLIPKNKQ